MCKDSARQAVLNQRMHATHAYLCSEPTPLPLSPSLIADGIGVRGCSYFPSNTLPLKIVFSTVDREDARTRFDHISEVELQKLL